MSKTPNSFSLMRKQSQNLASLQKKIKSQGKKDYSDDRYWTAEQDKAGNASAVIRFLPAPKGEEDAFVKIWSYAFKGPSGQWFIENCPTTIEKESPVLEANNKLWATKIPENEKIARERGRKTHYHANVLVVKDPANPDNEGKVFLFKFGTKIFEKIEAAMVPKFEDEDPINVFDPWAGADFKLRIVRKDKYANYDNSVFDKVKPISKDDAEIEKIWESEHPLQPLLAEDKFKSYDKLKEKMDRVLGSTGKPSTIDEDLNTADAKPAGKTKEVDEGESLDDLNLDIAEDDADLDAFKSLVE